MELGNERAGPLGIVGNPPFPDRMNRHEKMYSCGLARCRNRSVSSKVARVSPRLPSIMK